MEHVTSDLKLIDRLWNDPTYGLDGFSTEGGYIQPIDRDQAVDGNGHANYDGYVSAVKSKTTIRPCRNWKPTNSTRTPWNPTQGSGEPCLTSNNCYPTCAIWNTN